METKLINYISIILSILVIPLDEKILKSLISNDPELTSLNLSYRQLNNDDDIFEIIKSLINDTSLSHLDVSRNYIDDTPIEAISLVKSLKSINVSDNGLGIKSAKALSINKNLISLHIGGNYFIGDEGTEYLSQNGSIISLNIRNCNVTDKSTNPLSQNNTLTSLVMHTNDITDEGAKLLSTSKSLTSLNLHTNKMTKKCVNILS
jgi:Leucine-rich repeat (LRR) protein